MKFSYKYRKETNLEFFARINVTNICTSKTVKQRRNPRLLIYVYFGYYVLLIELHSLERDVIWTAYIVSDEQTTFSDM